MNALNNANHQVLETSQRLTSFAFPEAKSSQTGVSVRYVPSPDKKWYVFRILYGYSKQVADFLIDDGTYAYLAMVWKDKLKDGKRRRVLVPFLNLVFAYVTPQQAENYVRECSMSRFITYYYNHFETNEFGNNPPLTVTQSDMEPLIRVTSLQDVHVMEADITKCRFVSNDPVRVTSGNFEGVKGYVVRLSRQNRVMIRINGLSTVLVTAYIPSHCLEKI